MTVLTKKALADALKKRLETTELDNIRVKDITDDIGMNRQTFYYHFRDIYELLEWMFEQRANEILHDNIVESDMREMVKKIILYVTQDEKALRHIYSSINRQLLDRYLRGWVRPLVKSVIEDACKDYSVSEDDREFLVSIYVTFILGMTFEWFEQGMEANVMTKMDKFVTLVNGDLKDTIKRFEEISEEDKK